MYWLGYILAYKLVLDSLSVLLSHPTLVIPAKTIRSVGQTRSNVSPCVRVIRCGLLTGWPDLGSKSAGLNASGTCSKPYFIEFNIRYVLAGY
jgi:hypothetical protein